MLKSWRSRCASLGTVLFLALFAAAQQPDQPVPTYKSRSDLVLIPVHVQHKGKHASGLRREQFAIFDKGSPAPIAVFEEVRTDPGKVKSQPSAPNEFGTLEVKDTPRLTIIVFDAITTPTLQQTYFRREVVKFLKYSAQRGAPIGLVSLQRSGIHVIADFTTDPAMLAKAMGAMEGPSGGALEGRGVRHEDMTGISLGTPVAAFLAQRELQERLGIMQEQNARYDSLDQLDQLAEALTAIPGRKALVWAGAGFPINPGMVREETRADDIYFNPEVSKSGMNLSNTAGDLDRQRRTLERLNAANVAVYPVDTRGVTNTAFLDMDRKYGTDTESYLRHERDRQIVGMFRDVAAMTGGKACVGMSDMAKCLRDTLDDGEQYYLVGYYHRKAAASGWHEVSVKVKGDGLKVRAPAGYMVAPDSAKDPDRDLALALASPLDSSALRFRGAWEPKAVEAGRILSIYVAPQDLQLDAADGNHISFDIYLAAFSQTGERTMLLSKKIEQRLNGEHLQQFQTDGIRYATAVAIPPDTARLRFVVRDNLGGRVGSVTTAPPPPLP